MSNYGYALSSSQVASERENISKVDGIPFRRAFGAENMQKIFDRHTPDNARERIFPLPTTTVTFVSQVMSADHSAREAVTRANTERIKDGLNAASYGTGSYIKARQRLPYKMMSELVFSSALAMEMAKPNEWLWQERHNVKMVDGSTLTMADTPENQLAFPQHKNQGEGIGFPIARCAVVISLATGCIFDLQLAPWTGKGTGEHALLRKMDYCFEKGDVVLGDAYFPSYFRLADYVSRGIEGVFRLDGQRDVDMRKGKKLGHGDRLHRWDKPPRPIWMGEEQYALMPETMTVRVVRILVTNPGSPAQSITVVTTILDPRHASKDELVELFRQRWHCELDLRSIKSAMQMDHLRCKTPDMVRTEIMAHLLAYNLIRQTMCDAAIFHGLTPRQMSFTGAMQTINVFRELWSANMTRDQKMNARRELLKAIASHRVGNRLNRFEPRVVKRRPKAVPRMTKPRNQYKKNRLRSNAMRQ